MYISQTKAKNGILIVNGEQKWFVSWTDLDLLKRDMWKDRKSQKEIIVLNQLPS